MKELVEYIVKQLVNNPEAVVVEESNDNGFLTLLLTVDPSDMGMIIGKSGQTIKAIRKILTVKAIADNVRVNLRLNEPARNEEVEGAKESEESPEEITEDTSDSESEESK